MMLIVARKNIILIEEQNLKLRQYNEELQQFSYVVSHDMKAPLRTISSFIGLLDRTLPDKNKRQESVRACAQRRKTET